MSIVEYYVIGGCVGDGPGCIGPREEDMKERNGHGQGVMTTLG